MLFRSLNYFIEIIDELCSKIINTGGLIEFQTSFPKMCVFEKRSHSLNLSPSSSSSVSSYSSCVSNCINNNDDPTNKTQQSFTLNLVSNEVKTLTDSSSAMETCDIDSKDSKNVNEKIQEKCPRNDNMNIPSVRSSYEPVGPTK